MTSRNDLWWQSAVVYQIYPRSFADADGDGIGDLAGMLEHVDHLAQLGVDVVWLSPVYRSPMDDNGYDISDYQEIDPLFGSLAQFDTLLDALHVRDIKLVMDLVVNHTSDEHPWFVESRSSRANPKRDWYIWADGADGAAPPDIAAAADGATGADRVDGARPPNNWTSFFSGPAWEFDDTTGQYFLHLFSRKQPDLNWENPDVRAAVYQMMSWWLDRGVDGFRMDVINMISKTPGLPDGLEGTGGVAGASGRVVGGEHYLGGPRIHEFLHEMREQVFGHREGRYLTVGEMPGVTVEQARLFTDPQRGEVDMVFQFEHVGLDNGAAGKWDPRPLRLVDLKRSLGRWQEGLADVGWNSLYWDNHDQPRAVSRFGDDDPAWRVASAKALASVLHLHRGTPYIYQGEELGMTNVPFEQIDEFRDIESLNHYATALAQGEQPDAVLAALRVRSRDNARTPMQWNATSQAGFTRGMPWIEVNPNYTEINAAEQHDDPDSVFAHYRALIALRHTEPAVVHGTFTMLLPDDERVYAFSRRHVGVELLVVANFSREDIELDLPGWTEGELLLGNLSDPGPVLRGWEARIYRRPVRQPGVTDG